jgi:predicted DCC family thiol-disulfide oxidoreductase YuxK
VSTGPAVFYYDGDCGMCSRLVRRLSKFDSRGSIIWTPYQSLDEPPTGISWEDLDTAAYLISDAGDVCEGFYAIRGMLVRLQGLTTLGKFMHLPGVDLIGRPVYRLIARNRKRLSTCGM